jgi:hypothetical protein
VKKYTVEIKRLVAAKRVEAAQLRASIKGTDRDVSAARAADKK